MATLTARESEILTLAWECFKNDSTVNYAKLAELAGLKNNASATTAYLAAKKKMQANGSSKLTAREREILALAWKCFNTAPQVDYAQLAEKAVLKNRASATTAFLAAKKKMLASADSTADSTNSSNGDKSTTPAKRTRKTLPSARNKAVAPEDGDSIVEPASPSPAKKRKRANAVAEPSPKSAAILAAVADEGEEEAEAKEAKEALMKKRTKGKKARSELRGKRDAPNPEVKAEVEEEEMVELGLFESAQEFLKEEEED